MCSVGQKTQQGKARRGGRNNKKKEEQHKES